MVQTVSHYPSDNDSILINKFKRGGSVSHFTVSIQRAFDAVLNAMCDTTIVHSIILFIAHMSLDTGRTDDHCRCPHENTRNTIMPCEELDFLNLKW